MIRKTKFLRYLDMKTFKSITLLLASFSFGLADDHSSDAPVESDYYPITTISLPEGEVIEVSGIDILPGNKVAIASRRGDIFVGEGVWGNEPHRNGLCLPAVFMKPWGFLGKTDGFMQPSVPK